MPSCQLKTKVKHHQSTRSPMWCLHPSLIPSAHEQHCEMQKLSVYQIAQECGYMGALVLLYPRC